jgi:hypothetical protein
MAILKFEEFNKDFILEEYHIDSNIDNIVNEISKIVNKNIEVKLDILVDPYFDSKLKSEADRQKFINIVYRAYIKEYLNVLKEYGTHYVEGTGEKTNKYGEAGQNFAYNYINHPKFERTAKEWVKYDENNRGIGKPQYYKYFENVWSIACRRVVERYKDGLGKYKINLKFDHRYKNNKNNDFDGTLVVFNPNSNEFWKKRNLYKNQKYNV